MTTARPRKAGAAATSRTAGTMRAMRVSAGVKTFVMDQLAPVRGLDARAMFGGIGLYSEDVFFGILAADVLYFKVDDDSRRAYQSKRMEPFKPFADRTMTMSYYAVPPDVLEDSDLLAKWAQRAIGVASKAKISKTVRSKRR
jgi:DNA transformation protein